jgi:hypothetical protein
MQHGRIVCGIKVESLRIYGMEKWWGWEVIKPHEFGTRDGKTVGEESGIPGARSGWPRMSLVL